MVISGDGGGGYLMNTYTLYQVMHQPVINHGKGVESVVVRTKLKKIYKTIKPAEYIFSKQAHPAELTVNILM